MTDESMRVVVVDVDLDAPPNQQPKQSLDDGECVTVGAQTPRRRRMRARPTAA